MSSPSRPASTLPMTRRGSSSGSATPSRTSSTACASRSSTPTTAKPGSGGCCGGPNNHCTPDIAGFTADAKWKALDFQIDEPTLFYYDYNGTTSSDFIAKD